MFWSSETLNVLFSSVCDIVLRRLEQIKVEMEKRSLRVSEVQWNVLLDFLEHNPSLARGYNNSSQGRRESSRLWQEVAGVLNAQGSGTIKTSKYVSNYKSKLKKIVADNNADYSGTGGGRPRGTLMSDYDTRFLAILGPGFGQSALLVRVDPFPVSDLQQSTTLRQNVQSPSIIQDKVILEEVFMEPTERPVGTPPVGIAGDAAISSPPISPASAAAPPLPRRKRQNRYRSCPLAPLDKAWRILSQVEMQRAAADTAKAQALNLIGQNLGRLADVAQRYLNYYMDLNKDSSSCSKCLLSRCWLHTEESWLALP